MIYCWLIHKWSKWTDPERITKSMSFKGKIVYEDFPCTIQKRTCQKCNKIEIKELK